ncbi:hypothetical protein BCR37DRAFT_378271 [Protomyces lactucae-debilis]|uniref:Ubiquitin-like modifier-activating enzyme ATG7 n=1 Tax=Protomyces lactucae-debilis TaxID=2754530 RepID=A0A1Y2FL22_PROLT|nr:uncharacterized protein BCR37DRAFT_378271 [Protomyces lactucae-debilis]ORY84277.1 hypothetical protein BCR37DRAFT_378271 [Protomyces lactucae-debilis]
MPPLTFLPQATYISSEFWHSLSKQKIDVDKLREQENSITAAITLKAKQDEAPPRVDLDGSSFTADAATMRIQGTALNLNTIDTFKAYDKNEFLRRAAQPIQDAISDRTILHKPALLSSFALLCFADLKKYTYTYWAAFPALPSSWSASSSLFTSNLATCEAFFLIDRRDNTTHSLYADVPAQYRVFGFLDTSSHPSCLSWPARNYLFMISQVFNLTDLQLVAYRGSHPGNPSLLLNCHLEEPIANLPPVGWERDRNGRLAPRITALSSQLDPTILANDAVHLNLKLMRWRASPSLDLDAIKSTRCLLLGAGTLGCYTARLLMAWGVNQITFVDNGTVSWSNPVRQPLFRYTDAGTGKSKATVAAESLKEIYPGVNAIGVALSVPMLGHPLPTLAEAREKARREFEQLCQLIDSHDAVFLLMDSRESRWLPTVLGKAKNKIVLNAALGFDSYVVLRHGTTSNNLGCYFCNDVVAPSNSLDDRSLDQMCTVTRPGLAALASAHAVELLVSMLAHPDKQHASAPKDKNDGSNDGLLGRVPHTIRGFLGSFSNLVLRGEAFPQCSACSVAVLEAYEEGHWDWVQRALDDPAYIEQLSGLAGIKAAAAALDWDDDLESESGLESSS